MDEQEQILTQDQAFIKAHDILSAMKDSSADDGKTKSHAVLLAYDPEREAFQMVAINSDLDEVMALVLSCLATVRESIKNTSEDRTLN